MVEYTKRELDRAAALWNHVFESKIQVRVGLLTEQDRQYIKGNAWYENNLQESSLDSMRETNDLLLAVAVGFQKVMAHGAETSFLQLRRISTLPT